MGKINFHFVTQEVFNSGTPLSDHLYFVDKTSYIDLYKGSIPVKDPDLVKNGQDSVSFGSINSTGDINAGGTIKIKSKDITAVASTSANGMMSSTDKVSLNALVEAQSRHRLDGTIKIGSALLSYNNDALKVTFIEE